MKQPKYKVEIHFSSHPRPVPKGWTLQELLFGRFAQWSRESTETCKKKYRITVEEVEDEKT
jgi:hypothetical protein